MQVILHKTAVERLEVSLRATGISLGDSVRLEEEEGGEICVRFCRAGSWLGLIGRQGRWQRLGSLCEEASTLIAPALRDGIEFRVRVVEISPAHLNATRRDAIHLSIWGDRARLARAQARAIASSDWRAPKPSNPVVTGAAAG